LLERCSYECYLTDQLTEAVQARCEAVATRRVLDDRVAVGDGHRWLSRLAWLAGDNDTAQAEARRAVELLEREPPGRELAMAYGNHALMHLLAYDIAATRRSGARAIELAERVGESESLTHALTTVGTADLMTGSSAGAAKLQRGLEVRSRPGSRSMSPAHTRISARRP
jgi:hypothetical protein